MMLNDVLERARDVRYRLLDDEGVVIRQEAAEALVVNELGARWIDLVDGQRTVAEILTTLQAEYEVDPSQIEADSLEYLARLLDLGLLVKR